jgi:hypothetical protein
MTMASYTPGISADGDLVREEIFEPLKYLVQDRLDFLSLALDTGTAIKNKYYNQTVEIGYFNFSELYEAITSSTATTVKIKKQANNPNLLHAGSVIVMGAPTNAVSALGFSSERIVLTEDPIDNTTYFTCNNVLRGPSNQFATSATTYLINCPIYIEGAIQAEGYNALNAVNMAQNGTKIPAFTEIIDPFSVVFSGTNLAIAPQRVGGEGKIEIQMERGMQYLMNLLQIHSIRRPSSSGTPANSTTGNADSTTMRGLLDYCTNYNGSATDASRANFGLSIFDDIIENSVTKGGIKPKSSRMGGSSAPLVALLSDRQKKKLNPSLAGRLMQSPDNTDYVSYMGRYKGEADIDLYTLPKDCLRPDELIVMPSDIFSVHALSGRSYKERKLPEGIGDFETRWALGEYGTICSAPSLIEFYYNFAI